MKHKVTVNRDQELFVIHFGNQFSCLGFDVCKRQTIALQKELEITDKLPRKNSLRAYEYLQKLERLVWKMNRETGFRKSIATIQTVHWTRRAKS